MHDQYKISLDGCRPETPLTYKLKFFLAKIIVMIFKQTL